MALSEQTLRNIGKAAGIIAAVGIIVLLSYMFFDIIIILVVAVLLYFIFNPLVTFFENNGLNRFVSVLLVFAISGVVMFAGLSILIPKIATQLNALSEQFTQERINTLAEQIEVSTNNLIPFFNSGEFAQRLGDFLSSMVFESIADISKIVSSIVSIIAITVIVPFITFFLLKDNDKILKGMINVMPNRYFEVSYWVVKKISIQLGRFVRGWIFDAFMVGLMSAVGLTILGIENSITIGFIAGIGHLIPYFGPIIGGIPAIIISLIQFGDLSMMPQILLMFVIVYTIDNGYIQPHVFSKSTDIHPLMIILLILVGSQVLGVFGMLIAVPAATVIKTAAKEIYYGYTNYRIIRI